MGFTLSGQRARIEGWDHLSKDGPSIVEDIRKMSGLLIPSRWRAVAILGNRLQHFSRQRAGIEGCDHLSKDSPLIVEYTGNMSGLLIPTH
jgi:hypothetical protein